MSNQFPRNHHAIPPHMMEALQRYIKEGAVPGGFLQALLTNDLKAACERADDVNIRLIPVYVSWLYSKAPSFCWGYPNAIDTWLAHLKEKRDHDTELR